MAALALRAEVEDHYGLSLVVSLCLHAMLFAILFWSWHQPSTVMLETPKYVQAHLVKLTAHTPPAPHTTTVAIPPPPEVAEKPPARVVPPKEIVKPLPAKPQPSRLEIQKQNVEKARQKTLLAEKQKQEQIEKQKQEAAEKAALDKAAKEKQQADEDLAREMAEENAQQQNQADQSLVQSLADKIRQHMEQNWNRPPSAHKGMEVLLEIQLVPSGYVVGVSVVHSSGNPAFDLSAQQAVRKADPFLEVKEIPARVFDQHFRLFRMLCKDEEDL